MIIGLLVDRSGSMNTIRKDTIGGINSFIELHKTDDDGETFVTLAQFDDKYETTLSMAPLKEVPKFTEKDFIPRGMTALLDGIGRISSEINEKSRPGEKVILNIITDGYENFSKEWTRPMINDLIKSKEKDGWEVMFLGAGLDAIEVAQSFGIKESNAMSYDTRKMDAAFATMASSNLRGKFGGSVAFTNAEREDNS